LRKDRDHKTAAEAAFIIKGAELAVNFQPLAGEGELAAELFVGSDNPKSISLAGEAADRERKTVELLAMVFVGGFGFTYRGAAELDEIFGWFHK